MIALASTPRGRAENALGRAESRAQPVATREHGGRVSSRSTTALQVSTGNCAQEASGCSLTPWAKSRTSPGFGSSGSAGPQCLAHLPAEDEPVVFGVHSEVAEHYGVRPDEYPPHATTLDYVVAAAGG